MIDAILIIGLVIVIGAIMLMIVLMDSHIDDVKNEILSKLSDMKHEREIEILKEKLEEKGEDKL